MRQSNAPPIEFSVIIPVYNSLRFLKSCLEAAERAMASGGAAELILVDNGSTDGSWEWLQQEYGRRAKLLQVAGTISAVRNAGSRIAGGAVLVFIDADCVIVPDYFSRLRNVLGETREAAATGAMYALPERPHWVEKTWQELHRRPADGWVNYLNSGNLVVRREAFEAVGAFDELLTTGEDADLGQRLNAAGFRIYESHLLRTVHLGNPKSLRHFFRKQRWHAEGMFGTARREKLDKPLVMTAVHLAMNFLGVFGLFVLPMNFTWRVAVLAGCMLAAPAAAIVFRAATRGGFYRPLRSLLLYHLYFDARALALLRIVFGSGNQNR